MVENFRTRKHNGICKSATIYHATRLVIFNSDCHFTFKGMDKIIKNKDFNNMMADFQLVGYEVVDNTNGKVVVL